jgi:hypothetical protein
MRNTNTRPAIVFLVILTLGLSFAVVPGNVPETAFDESEALPYESSPLFSIVVPQVAARITQQGVSSLHLRPVAPSLFAAARDRDTDASRSAEARVSLTLVCTLRC